MIYQYRAIYQNRLTQDLGQSRACAKTDNGGRVIRPFQIYTKTFGSCWGGVDFYNAIGLKGHNGRDWGIPTGTALFHAGGFDGWIRYDNDSEGGLGVDVVSDEPLLQCNELNCNEKHYIKYRAWHLSDRPIPDKSKVKEGYFIGLSGNTGASSAPHLHDAMRWCDKDGRGIHTDNGLRGVITNHPELRFVNEFVLTVHELKQKKTLLTTIVSLLEQLVNLKTKVGGIIKKLLNP